ncbi:hypothetical protein MUK42_08392 [Musa troglodytarum]|uniref:Uncharacterized protein n=1 Tax=Musa troglodytarum TaxID=320322 RepID=A0A9E7JAJ9_9LILI|nr:hypothetical protein MUK42_08392 [Musa troglodytarum]
MSCIRLPAALLAEPLAEAGDHDDGGLGVGLADLVPAVVALRLGEGCGAPPPPPPPLTPLRAAEEEEEGGLRFLSASAAASSRSSSSSSLPVATAVSFLVFSLVLFLEGSVDGLRCSMKARGRGRRRRRRREN